MAVKVEFAEKFILSCRNIKVQKQILHTKPQNLRSAHYNGLNTMVFDYRDDSMCE